MRRRDFEAIWQKPSKCVNDDVVWVPKKHFRAVLVVEDMPVLLGSEYDVMLNATYHCGTGEITFNFKAIGVGSISRYDLGGQDHKGFGRYHQHIITSDNCVRRQLPNVVTREDFIGLTPRESWEQICQEWQITHVGEFFDPEIEC